MVCLAHVLREHFGASPRPEGGRYPSSEGTLYLDCQSPTVFGRTFLFEFCPDDTLSNHQGIFSVRLARVLHFYRPSPIGLGTWSCLPRIEDMQVLIMKSVCTSGMHQPHSRIALHIFLPWKCVHWRDWTHNVFCSHPPQRSNIALKIGWLDHSAILTSTVQSNPDTVPLTSVLISLQR